MVPWAPQVQIPNGISAVFCKAHGRVAILHNGPPISSYKCPFPWGIWTYLTHGFLGPPKSSTNGISIGSAVFAQLTAECPYTLQWASPSLLKTVPPYRRSEPPSNIWFLRPTWALNPSSISIDWAIFVGLATVTDWQTDQQTQLVTVGCVYIHSTAMRHNNNNSFVVPDICSTDTLPCRTALHYRTQRTSCSNQNITHQLRNNK